MKTINWIKYWRTSLADAESININISALNAKYKPETFDPEENQLSDELFQVFWPEEELNALKEDEVLDKEILISPLSMVPRLSHIKAKTNEEEIAPFWISALISSENELKPGNRKFPLIPRKILEPVTYREIVFSSVKKVDKVLAKSEINTNNWLAYYSSMEHVFRTITGEEITDFKSQEYFEVKPQWVIMPDEVITGASVHILELYNKLIKEDKYPKLLKTMLTETSPVIQRQYSKAEVFKKSAAHLGQMNKGFGLSPSQRKALSHFMELRDGEVLAVNGPPGTGKTTLIQSVIADNMIKAALAGGDPMVTVASSTNNQAITNIIESFSKGGASTLFEERWLERVGSFALYMVSSDPNKIRKSKEKGWLYHTAKKDESSFSELETTGYVAAAKKYFLEQFNAFSELNTTSLTVAKNYLHKKIRLNSAKIKDRISDGERKTFDTAESRAAFLNKVDTDIRYENFYYAVHYWELRWIEATEKALEENTIWKNTEKYTMERMHRFAMLCPCFVSTFHMLPKMMQYVEYPARETNYLFNFVDLLIVDEAGQVSPEVGVPSFSFAKKALVVGDNYQIEPVWNVDGKTDEGNLIKHKLYKQGDEERIEELVKKGYLSSNGSLMKLAQKSCYFEFKTDERGLLLTEHRRCLDQIISYCNELVYDNQLEPMTSLKYESFDFLPPMGYLQIKGQAEKEGGSWSNRVEAEKMIRWLKVNEQKIIDWIYRKEQQESKHPEEVEKKTLPDLVGIVTPFTAHKRHLTRALNLNGYQASLFQYGTVHSLQGAEKDIVLFSSVYTSDLKTGYFFDMGPNMLNVAVSRAKRSFIVAGDSAIFKKGSRKVPSGLLGTYLKDEPVF